MAITPAATAEVAHATLAGCHRLRRRVQTLLDRQILIGEPSQAERDQLIESILKWHLVPTLGPKRLDAITNEQVQRLKLALANRAPKTVNNVLTVLSTLLKRAVEWGELQRLPCTIKLLPNPRTTMGFHDFEQYERLLTVAR